MPRNSTLIWAIANLSIFTTMLSSISSDVFVCRWTTSKFPQSNCRNLLKLIFQNEPRDINHRQKKTIKYDKRTNFLMYDPIQFTQKFHPKLHRKPPRASRIGSSPKDSQRAASTETTALKTRHGGVGVWGIWPHSLTKSHEKSDFWSDLGQFLVVDVEKNVG